MELGTSPMLQHVSRVSHFEFLRFYIKVHSCFDFLLSLINSQCFYYFHVSKSYIRFSTVPVSDFTEFLVALVVNALFYS